MNDSKKNFQKGGQLNELALFAGAGGGLLGGHLLGWRTVCAVEWEPYPASVLIARQNDGILPPFPVWDDIQTFDGRPWRGRVDVISGGFPCQDISTAGKGAGIDGKRSSMWGHMARIVSEVRPRFVFVENSPMLVGRGLARVLGDLAQVGYDAKWCVLGAHHVAAPHKRDRIWIVATNSLCQWGEKQGCYPTDEEACGCGTDHERRSGSNDRGESGTCEDGKVANATSERCGEAGKFRYEESEKRSSSSSEKLPDSLCERCRQMEQQNEGRKRKRRSAIATRQCPVCGWSEGWWAVEPDVGRVAHGVAARVDRLKAIGNGQVPAVADLAWKILNQPNNSH